MATLLAAQLKLNGLAAWQADMGKVTKSSRDAEKAVRSMEKSVGSYNDALDMNRKAYMSAATQGAGAYADKLKAVSKTTFAAGEATAAATTKMAVGLNDVQRAARGLAATSGGLGKLAPIVEAIASPAGLAALALGGLAIAVAKVWKDYDEFSKRDIRDKLAAEEGAVKAATVAWTAFYDALARGDSAAAAAREKSKALSDAVFGENRARAEAEIKRLEESNKRLGATKLAGLSESDIAAVVKQIAAQEESIRLLRGSLEDMATATGGVVNAIKSHEDAEKARADALKKSAEEARKLREEMDKIAAGGFAALGQIGLSLVTPPQASQLRQADARSDGSAQGYLNLFGDSLKGFVVAGQEVADEIAAKMKKAAEEMTIGEKFLARMPNGVRGAAQTVIGATTGNVGKVADAIMNSKTVVDGVLNALAALFTSSKGFAAIMDSLNPVLQVFADTLGAGMETLAPAVKKLADAVSPLIQMFTVLHKSWPSLILAMNAIAELGRAVDRVSDVIINSAIGLLKGIRRFLANFGITWKVLDNAIDSLRHLRDATDDVSEAMRQFAGIIPEGYKLLELRRYEHMPALPPDAFAGMGSTSSPASSGGGYSGSSGSGATSGSGVVVQGNLVLQGVQDVPSLHRALARHGSRESVVRTGRPVYSMGGA